MSAIYKIIGNDGLEYGPLTSGQIRQWIAEGRIESRTPVFVDGAADWNFIGLLPEFTSYFAAPPGTPPTIAPPPRAASPAGQMAKTNSYAQAGLVFGIFVGDLLLLRVSIRHSRPRFLTRRTVANQCEPPVA